MTALRLVTITLLLAGAPAANAQAVSDQAVPVLMLPAGGADFRQAVLNWSALPAGETVGDELALPVAIRRLSSRFGVRQDPIHGGLRIHRGIDIPDTAGAPVRAAAAGVVVFAGWSRGYGNLVQIDHGGGNETRYGHLAQITVDTGAVLQQGMTLGLVGSTGRSTGPHLHFEVREDGVAVDPLLRLGKTISASGANGPQMPSKPSWNGFDGNATLLPQSHLR